MLNTTKRVRERVADAFICPILTEQLWPWPPSAALCARALVRGIRLVIIPRGDRPTLSSS
jgi:hypothetical protein